MLIFPIATIYINVAMCFIKWLMFYNYFNRFKIIPIPELCHWIHLINIKVVMLRGHDLRRINVRKYPSKIIKMTRLDNPSCSVADDIFVKTLLLAYIKMARDLNIHFVNYSIITRIVIKIQSLSQSFSWTI